jgi:preprotein translocase subunit SecE
MSSEESVDNDTTSEEHPELEQDPDEGLPPGDELAAADEGAGKKTLGIERWVQLAFVVAALTLIWLADHLISGIWYLFADPDEALVSVGAVVAGILGTILLYQNRPSYTLVHDVVEELSKVTWPTRKETSQSTVVVVITSVVAALILFMFDSVWSAVTDLVYKV